MAKKPTPNPNSFRSRKAKPSAKQVEESKVRRKKVASAKRRMNQQAEATEVTGDMLIGEGSPHKDVLIPLLVNRMLDFELPPTSRDLKAVVREYVYGNSSLKTIGEPSLGCLIDCVAAARSVYATILRSKGTIELLLPTAMERAMHGVPGDRNGSTTASYVKMLFDLDKTHPRYANRPGVEQGFTPEDYASALRTVFQAIDELVVDEDPDSEGVAKEDLV